MTDLEVKAKLAEIWTTAAAEVSEPVRVIPRWKLSLKGKEVLSALRSLTNNQVVNGVYITRVQRKSKRLGTNHLEYKWTYAMFYFRSYDEGTDANNSEDKVNALLEAVASKFEESGDLGLEFVDDHDEFQVENIDTLDLRTHVAQTFITVNITKQPE